MAPPRGGPGPEALFHEPVTPLDLNLFEVGRSFHWLRYGREQAPVPGAYKGYTLYSDPYHPGLKRVSFLVGSDCSHFVHRLFQLLGADMGPRDGYVRGPIDAELLDETHVFRWRGPLRSLGAASLDALLLATYPHDPAPCRESR